MLLVICKALWMQNVLESRPVNSLWQNSCTRIMLYDRVQYNYRLIFNQHTTASLVICQRFLSNIMNKDILLYFAKLCRHKMFRKRRMSISDCRAHGTNLCYSSLPPWVAAISWSQIYMYTRYITIPVIFESYEYLQSFVHMYFVPQVCWLKMFRSPSLSVHGIRGCT